MPSKEVLPDYQISGFPSFSFLSSVTYCKSLYYVGWINFWAQQVSPHQLIYPDSISQNITGPNWKQNKPRKIRIVFGFQIKTRTYIGRGQKNTHLQLKFGPITDKLLGFFPAAIGWRASPTLLLSEGLLPWVSASLWGSQAGSAVKGHLHLQPLKPGSFQLLSPLAFPGSQPWPFLALKK